MINFENVSFSTLVETLSLIIIYHGRSSKDDNDEEVEVKSIATYY